MRVEYHPDAAEELSESALFYERVEEGLGFRFRRKYLEALRRIERNPEAFRRFDGNVRKLNVSRFPYAVVYICRSGVIYVVAVMPLHRKPFYWRDRV